MNPVQSSTAIPVMWRWICPECDLVTHIGMLKGALQAMNAGCVHFVAARQEEGRVEVSFANETEQQLRRGNQHGL